MDEEQDALGLIRSELSATLDGIDPGSLTAFRHRLETCGGAVFVTGQGRSGLVGRMFAMRLMHLGLRCHVVGDTLTPAFRAGDCLVVISGSGRTPGSLHAARCAREQGGAVIAVTHTPAAPLAEMADLGLCVPVAGSAQFGGTRFEQACLIVMDAIVHTLARRDAGSFERMVALHANIQ